MTPQEMVERALAAARSDDCVVIADETSSANLRWAGNTLTTNGVSRSRQLTVIAISRDGTAARTGVVSRAGVRGDQIEDVARQAEKEAAEGSPAEAAQPLLGAGQGTRDFADVGVGAILGDLTRRLEWARRRVELPAGRYETVLPPAAVADLLIYLYWSAGAKDALDGRTVFSKPGGGTRVGERLSGLPLTLRSDPAPAAAPGLSCAPFVVAHASTRRSSVFDNGL